jgi:hypothetical protein
VTRWPTRGLRVPPSAIIMYKWRYKVRFRWAAARWEHNLAEKVLYAKINRASHSIESTRVVDT